MNMITLTASAAEIEELPKLGQRIRLVGIRVAEYALDEGEEVPERPYLVDLSWQPLDEQPEPKRRFEWFRSTVC